MTSIDRILTAIIFVSVGPLIGGVCAWCYVASTSVFGGESGAFSGAVSSLPIFVFGGYIAGLVPAFIAGIAYAALPTIWQRVIVGLVIGACASWLFGLAILALGGLPRFSGEFEKIFAGAGAAAAAVSAFLARHLRKANWGLS